MGPPVLLPPVLLAHPLNGGYVARSGCGTSTSVCMCVCARVHPCVCACVDNTAMFNQIPCSCVAARNADHNLKSAGVAHTTD